MIWYEDLYVSDNIIKKKNKLVKKISKGKLTKNIYVIALSRNDKELLDVFQANVLKQQYYKNQTIVAVGLAKGEDMAYETVKKIIDDCYGETGSVDVKGFINNRMGDTTANA